MYIYIKLKKTFKVQQVNGKPVHTGRFRFQLVLQCQQTKKAQIALDRSASDLLRFRPRHADTFAGHSNHSQALPAVALDIGGKPQR